MEVIGNGLILGSCYCSSDTVVTGVLRQFRLNGTSTTRDRLDHSGISALERKEHFDREVA